MIKKKDPLEKGNFIYRDVGPYLGLGTQLAVIVVLLFFLGKWLDDELNTLPLFTMLLSFLGGAAGIYNFIKSVIQINDRKKERKNS